MSQGKVLRAAVAVLLPFLLAGCFLAPGKFTSTLTVNKDRSFAFTYAGEVIAIDLGKEMADGFKGAGDQGEDEDDAKPAGTGFRTTAASDDAAKAAEKKAEFERKCRAIAAALAKEAGYRRAEYVGDGKFLIDYAVKGVLTHNFIYPFNMDAEAVFPFIVMELRADGRVRMKAPAFAKDGGGGGSTGGPLGDLGPSSKLDGTFTLDTDAELVSQNNEGGAEAVGGRKRVVWTVTPLNKTAPMAVLGF